MSIVPFCKSGMRLAEVTGWNATLRFGMASCVLTASTIFAHRSIA